MAIEAVESKARVRAINQVSKNERPKIKVHLALLLKLLSDRFLENHNSL